jgi:hypothetical protein
MVLVVHGRESSDSEFWKRVASYADISFSNGYLFWFSQGRYYYLRLNLYSFEL